MDNRGLRIKVMLSIDHKKIIEKLISLINAKNLNSTKLLIEDHFHNETSNERSKYSIKEVSKLQEEILSDHNVSNYGNLLSFVLDEYTPTSLRLTKNILKLLNAPDVTNAKERQFNALFYYIIIQHVINKLNLPNPVLIGGWATFFTYYSIFGEDAFKDWRGSHDLDLIAIDLTTLSAIKDSVILTRYGLSASLMHSLSLENKYSTTLIDIERSIQVHCDIAIPNNQGMVIIDNLALERHILLESSVNLRFSETLSVHLLNPMLLILAKLSANRPKDYLDIQIITYSLLEAIKKNDERLEKELINFITILYEYSQKQIAEFKSAGLL
ncbi:MAG: hypothetical protein QW076_05450 [Candidatus Anstonellales archaeon]